MSGARPLVADATATAIPDRVEASQALGNRKTLARFVFSVAAMNFGTLVGTAIALRWIEPVNMGIWHTLLVASNYLMIVRAGIVNGLGRELPFAIGRQDRARANAIVATASSYNIVCGLVSGAAFLVAIPFFWSAGRPWRVALPAMAVQSACNLYLAYLTATFRSDREFSRLSKVQTTQAALSLLLPVSVIAFGFPGLCVHSALQTVITTIQAYRLRPFKVPARFDWPVAKELVLIGLPLFTAGYLQLVSAGFDRIILIARGGIETVGYYAPAIVVISAMTVVPGALATYVYPRMSYALGMGHGRNTLGRMAWRVGAVSLTVQLPICLVGWWAAPYVTRYFVPQYVASVGAVRWSLIAGLVWSFTPVTQALGSLKAFKALAVYVGVLLAARWSLPWLLSGVMSPLEGVALGNVLAGITMAFVSLVLVRGATGRIAPNGDQS